jgi:hypothetical protein
LFGFVVEENVKFSNGRGDGVFSAVGFLVVVIIHRRLCGESDRKIEAEEAKGVGCVRMAKDKG